MKINWFLRLQNKTTLVTLITLVITFVYQILSFCDVVPKISQEEITNAILILVNILVVLGVVVDPTTEGIGDSEEALTYKEPKKLNDKGDEPDE